MIEKVPANTAIFALSKKQLNSLAVVLLDDVVRFAATGELAFGEDGNAREGDEKKRKDN